MLSGAIIGDGDRKRAPFLILGLAPWYGTILLFLEQIAPSPAAHARTCREDFCECRAGEMASEIHKIFYAFGPQLNTFMSVGIWLKYFRRKLLQFEWSKAVSNLGTSSFISLTKLCSATSFYTRTSHFSTLTSTNVEDWQLFHDTAKTRYTWIYSASRLQSFPPLATRFRGSRDSKVKKYYRKFEFRLNCKQSLTFHWSRPNTCMSNNRFISVDAA